MTSESAERERAILSLEGVVKYQAHRFSRRYRVPFDELLAVAWSGAIKAVDRYDPGLGRGAKLASYATHRIRGELLDWAREEDHLSRDTREKVRRGTLPAERYRKPTSLDEELERRPSLLNTLISTRDEWAPEATVIGAEWAASLHAAVEQLSNRERLIIRHVDLEGGVMADLQDELGVTESRISQIRKHALAKLAVMLERADGNDIDKLPVSG
jgi:RNA polymerase sigma factor FliA